MLADFSNVYSVNIYFTTVCSQINLLWYSSGYRSPSKKLIYFFLKYTYYLSAEIISIFVFIIIFVLLLLFTRTNVLILPR